MRVICLVACRSWTSLVKLDPVNKFVAYHVTESLLHKWGGGAHKVTMLTFHRSWFGTEKSVIQIIVISSLILKMKSEDALLEKWCISLHFCSVTATFFINYYCETRPLTYSQNNSVQMLLVFNGLWPFVIKTSNSSHYSCPRSVYSILAPCVALWNTPIHNEDVHTYSIQ